MNYYQDPLARLRAGYERRKQVMNTLAGCARKTMERASKVSGDVLIDCVIRAEHYIAFLRTYDAAGYYRGDNYERLVRLEKRLRTLKSNPTVRVALEL